jgi:hypothetical protein
MEIILQSPVVARTALGTTDIVHFHKGSLDSDGCKIIHKHSEGICIEKRRLHTEGFHSELIELTVASFLRAFIAEHGARIIEFLQRVSLIKTVFDIMADHTCSPFRAQGDTPPFTVFKSIHFLLDDIGTVSDTPGKELGSLHHRKLDLFITVQLEEQACFFLDPLKNTGFPAGKIPHPS